MPKVPFAVLDPAPREEWLELPVDLTDPAAGTARLRLRELPSAEWSRLRALYTAKDAGVSALRAASASRRAELARVHAGPAVGRVEGQLGDEFAEEIGLALEARRDVEREIVARAVVGHDPESFRVEAPAGLEGEAAERLSRVLEEYGLSAEEAATALAAGEVRVRFAAATWCLPSGASRPGASPAMVRLYERCAAGFLGVIVGAVVRFQSGEILTPAELYARAQPKPPREALLAQKAALLAELAEIEQLLASEEDAPDPLAATASPGSPSA